MLDVRVLGPVEVVEDDHEVALGGSRQRGLFALLVLSAGVAVPTERLVDRLWSGDPPPSATVTLQGYVARLRRAVQASQPVEEATIPAQEMN